MSFIRPVLLLAFVLTILQVSAFSQSAGSVGGQVVDPNGAVIVGATVAAVSADGKEKRAVTNDQGEYLISGLAAANYTLRALAPNFSLYENGKVVVVAGGRTQLIIVMTVAGVSEKGDVSNTDRVSTDEDNNANATVIKDKNLGALPDDPDELQAALQSLAGAAAGPSGGRYTSMVLQVANCRRRIRSARYELIGAHSQRNTTDSVSAGLR